MFKGNNSWKLYMIAAHKIAEFDAKNSEIRKECSTIVSGKTKTKFLKNLMNAILLYYYLGGLFQIISGLLFGLLP